MRRNNKGKYLIIILLLIVSIGFAFLSSRLDFNGIANVRPINWKIYFDNVQKNFGQEFEITEPSTSGEDTTSINFEVELADPGDSYSFDVDIVNGGSIDAMYKITYDWSTYDDEHPELYIFEVKYKDGIELQENDLLKKNSRETITVTVAYNRDIDIESLPTEDRSVNYNLTLEYEQANVNGNTAVEREHRYTITYDLDGGVNNPNNPSTYTDRSSTFTLQNPTKEGYTFAGWTIGKNLFISYALSGEGEGINYIRNNDQSISFSGTSQYGWANITNSSGHKLYPGYYTMSITEPKIFNLCIKGTYPDTTIVEDCITKNISTSKTIMISQNYTYYFFLAGLTPNEYYDDSVYIQLEEGSKATSYEPYISTPTTNIVINSGSDGNRTYKANWVAN